MTAKKAQKNAVIETIVKTQIIFCVSLLLFCLAGCGDALKQENKLLSDKIGALSVENDKNGLVLAEKMREIIELKKVQDQMREELLKKEKEIVSVITLKKAALDSFDELKKRVSELSTKLDEKESEMRRLQKNIVESATGEVRGVVTYFFNANFGYKPDLGATVLICNSNDFDDFNYLMFVQYRLGYLVISGQMIADYGSTSAEKIQKALAAKGFQGNDEYNLLVKKLKDIYARAEREKIATTSVDGSGVFKKTLKAGEYFILIKSNQRKGRGDLEYNGKIEMQKITIKSGEETSVDIKFNVD
jgi:hypothetical protein